MTLQDFMHSYLPDYDAKRKQLEKERGEYVSYNVFIDRYFQQSLDAYTSKVQQDVLNTWFKKPELEIQGFKNFFGAPVQTCVKDTPTSVTAIPTTVSTIPQTFTTIDPAPAAKQQLTPEQREHLMFLSQQLSALAQQVYLSQTPIDAGITDIVNEDFWQLIGE